MTTEEDSIEQASKSRREMLKALRAAKELSITADADLLTNEKKAEDEVNENGEKSAEEDSTEHAAETTDSEMPKPHRSAKDESTMLNANNTEDSEETETEDKGLGMKFRNYLPHDKKLQEGKLAPAVLPKFEDPVAAAPPPSDKTEDPFVNIAPKKPNWDLRRDVQKKLDKLERRTQKALNQIMQDQERVREALEAENGATEEP